MIYTKILITVVMEALTLPVVRVLLDSGPRPPKCAERKLRPVIVKP